MTLYTERLRVAWWAWPIAIGAAVMLAAELAIGALTLRHPLTFVVAGLVAVAGLLMVGRIRVAVADGELRVDDARLPLSVIAGVETITPERRRDLLGPDADPQAFVIQRPWIGGGVRIDLNDPDDPTPYWFISTRHPEELATALGAPQPQAGTVWTEERATQSRATREDGVSGA